MKQVNSTFAFKNWYCFPCLSECVFRTVNFSEITVYHHEFLVLF